MSHLLDRVTTGFQAEFGTAPDFVARAPGRVNLIGEHTDYNGGFALPVAIGAETQVAVRRNGGDGPVRVIALDFEQTDLFIPGDMIERHGDVAWQNYVRGVFAMLSARGVSVPSCDIAVAGDLPKGTGLSSSASLEVALTTALLKLVNTEWTPTEIALLAQSAECDFVGMRCGNLDQIASAATQEGSALLIDCRSLALQVVPIPADCTIMIVQSGVARNLVEGRYNVRRAECEEAARLLGVDTLRDASMKDLELLRGRTSDNVVARARHIISENKRVLDAVAALTAGDMQSVGRLLRSAHASQRDDFEITVEATDQLSEVMCEAIGSEGGARQTGGGFGGAVIGVMRNASVEAVREAVLSRYRTPSGEPPDIMVDKAHGGASIAWTRPDSNMS